MKNKNSFVSYPFYEPKFIEGRRVARNFKMPIQLVKELGKRNKRYKCTSHHLIFLILDRFFQENP